MFVDVPSVLWREFVIFWSDNTKGGRVDDDINKQFGKHNAVGNTSIRKFSLGEIDV